MGMASENVRAPLRGSLSREDILAAGLRVARRSDLGSLNMRDLARELGVTPMAIYHHFESKSALIEGIVDRYVTEIAVTHHGVDKADWRAWLKRTFLNIHRGWKDAPGVQPMLSSLLHYGPGLMQLIEDTLEVLLKAGLSKRDALRVFSAMTGLTMGHAILKTMKVPLFGETPCFQALAAELQRESRVETIEFELDLILDSVERLIVRAKGAGAG